MDFKTMNDLLKQFALLTRKTDGQLSFDGFCELLELPKDERSKAMFQVK